MIDDLLKDCGLNASETKVLLHLVRKGASSASRIAKDLELKRPTTYSILENLCSAGLVSKQKQGSYTLFSAASAEHIPSILETSAKRKLERVTQATGMMQAELLQLREERVRSVVEYEVKDFGVSDSAYVQHFDFVNAGDFRAIFNPNLSVSDFTKDGVAEFLRITSKEEHTLLEIAVDGPMTRWYIGEISNPNHEVRVLDSASPYYTNMILRDGVVALTHYDREGMNTIRIEHPDYYNSMLFVFERLWASLPSTMPLVKSSGQA
jgi:predicted transcriptional regulator